MIELQIEVLVLEPHANGLAFAVFASGELVDWGSLDVRAEKSASVRQQSRALARHLSPAIVGIEDVDQPDCKRGPRIRALLLAVRQDLLDDGFKLARLPRSAAHQSPSAQAANWRTYGSKRPRASPWPLKQSPLKMSCAAVRKAIRFGQAICESSRIS